MHSNEDMRSLLYHVCFKENEDGEKFIVKLHFRNGDTAKGFLHPAENQCNFIEYGWKVVDAEKTTYFLTDFVNYIEIMNPV